MCKVGTDEVLLCSLREGALETTNLDLVLDSYTEFSLAPKNKQSKASLHLAGYLIPEEEGSMEDDEDDEEGTCCSLDRSHNHHQHRAGNLQGQHRLQKRRTSLGLSGCDASLSAAVVTIPQDPKRIGLLDRGLAPEQYNTETPTSSLVNKSSFLDD